MQGRQGREERLLAWARRAPTWKTSPERTMRGREGVSDTLRRTMKVPCACPNSAAPAATAYALWGVGGGGACHILLSVQRGRAQPLAPRDGGDLCLPKLCGSCSHGTHPVKAEGGGRAGVCSAGRAQWHTVKGKHGPRCVCAEINTSSPASTACSPRQPFGPISSHMPPKHTPTPTSFDSHTHTY